MAGTVLSPGETRIPRIVQAVRQLLQGRSDAGGTVTLRESQTTTTVAAPNCGASSKIFLTPATANAAAMSPPYVLAANVVLGSFVISHASVAHSDLSFNWIALG